MISSRLPLKYVSIPSSFEFIYLGTEGGMRYFIMSDLTLNYEKPAIFFIFVLFPGDLFDILLPMLTIYQEYVRNHHYSLQVLTECKQNPAFVNLLERLENKPACHARSLENFLIVPMHQVKLATK